jgi:hypothetical protein
MSKTELCLAVIAACVLGVTCFVAGRESVQPDERGSFMPVTKQPGDQVIIFDTRTGELIK